MSYKNIKILDVKYFNNLYSAEKKNQKNKKVLPFESFVEYEKKELKWISYSIYLQKRTIDKSNLSFFYAIDKNAIDFSTH